MRPKFEGLPIAATPGKQRTGVNDMKNGRNVNGYSVASLVSSSTPVVILLAGYLICLAFSGGNYSDNGSGAVWWYFIALIMGLVPVAIIGNILSVIFGILGLKKQKTIFAWLGIIIVLLEVLAVLALIFIIWRLAGS